MTALHQIQWPILYNVQSRMLIDRLRLLHQAQRVAKLRLTHGQRLRGWLQLGSLRSGRRWRKILLRKHKFLLLLLLLFGVALFQLETVGQRAIVNISIPSFEFLWWTFLLNRGSILLGLVRVFGSFLLAQLRAGRPPYRLLNRRAIRLTVRKAEA